MISIAANPACSQPMLPSHKPQNDILQPPADEITPHWLLLIKGFFVHILPSLPEARSFSKAALISSWVGEPLLVSHRTLLARTTSGIAWVHAMRSVRSKSSRDVNLNIIAGRRGLSYRGCGRECFCE